MSALTGKSVLFTGAGAGIGRAVVARYVAEGAQVIAVDQDEQRLSELRNELGASIVPVVADVRDWAANVRAVQTAIDEFGRLDVYVGNAAIHDGARALEDIPGDQVPEAFHELFSVNVLGPLLGVRAATEHLIASQGCVILTASFASFHTAGGGVLYTASKHAIVGVVRQLAYELAPDVRVNGVAPGVAPTRLGGIRSLDQNPQTAVLDGTREALPLQKIPDTDAYSGTFTLLASSAEAGAITGTVVEVDSGLGIRGMAKPGGRTDHSG